MVILRSLAIYKTIGRRPAAQVCRYERHRSGNGGPHVSAAKMG